jgi:hypothetical protein
VDSSASTSSAGMRGGIGRESSVLRGPARLLAGVLLALGAALGVACAQDSAESTARAPVVVAAATDSVDDRALAVADEADAGDESTTTGSVVRLPPVTSVETNGPFATTQDLTAGPRGRSGIFRPTELGRDGLKHPIFVWGCGGGSNPASYADVLRRVASHGFVVIAEVSAIGDNGAPLTTALTWLSNEASRSGSPFYGKLATDVVAVGGHSIGSVNSFFVAPDKRWKTSIHVAGGSLDDVRNVRAPTTGIGGSKLVHPTALICSENDTFGNVEKTRKDYERATAPVFFTVMRGTEHIGAAREGLPVIIAWLRWHLAGETERRSMFVEPQGQFRTGRYVSQIKNWPL